MKNLIILIATTLLISIHVHSQSCLPEGITFTTQQQINDFQTNYPGCTEIEGDVEIDGNSIHNLDSLSVLLSIGGNLLIETCNNLSNLNGLSNMESIAGDFLIKDNDNLTSFEDLTNLSHIGGEFNIEDNYHLTSLEGLSSLSSILGNIIIEHNNSLISLTGLDNVNPASIHHLNITRNNSLSTCHVASICGYLANPNGKVTIYLNAEGCSSPTQIAANCGITLPCLPYGDYYFFTQSEIDNFQTYYPGCTEITGNVEISGDDIVNLEGLNVLTSISWNFLIEDNSLLLDLTGLENLTTIGGSLVIGSGYQDYQALTSLSGLDNLTSIGGQLYISKNDDLTGLFASNSLASIEELYIRNNNMLTGLTGLNGINGELGNLEISNNASLLSLAGLDDITSVGYIAAIRNNNALSNIEGLGNLLSTEWLYITNNPILTDLSGLGNISITVALSISENDALTSLSGLENMDPGPLCYLSVFDNNTLSTCHVQSICDYLINPNGPVNIHNNAPGCNSETEVYDVCWAKTNETAAIENNISVFPNPAKSTITILNSSKEKLTEAIIYSLFGQIILRKEDPENTIDISMIQQGIYVIEIKTNDFKVREKLIIKK